MSSLPKTTLHFLTELLYPQAARAYRDCLERLDEGVVRVASERKLSSIPRSPLQLLI